MDLRNIVAIGASAGGVAALVLRRFVLEPATATSQIDDTPAPTVLELRLEPLKA
jgi:hypothetical protein